MKAPALAEAATHLPWLSPCAASLVRMARAWTSASWNEVRADPGCVLLLLRHAQPTLDAAWPPVRGQASVFDGALDFLGQGSRGFVDWSRPEVRPVYRAGLHCARLAQIIAGRCGGGADQAWVAGLLAGLGWLAVAAVAPDEVNTCLNDPGFRANPVAVQRQRWGLDQAEIARRLARHWQLPAWAAVPAGYLDLDADLAISFGADPQLLRIVQLAVGLVQRHGGGLGLPVRREPEELAAALGLADLDGLSDDLGRHLEEPAAWGPPASVSLLPELLAVAAENRRLAAAPVITQLEAEVDALHRVLQQQRETELTRLQTEKMCALAELAAGAGHEINNPLAVISGQAQYLLKKIADWRLQLADALDPSVIDKSLQTVVKQTQRIHDILAGLMQFARPPRPQMQLFDLGALLRDVTTSLGDLAAQQRVQLLYREPERQVNLCADPKQLRLAVNCLLRNAVEAAPPDGWAAIRVEMGAEWLQVVVEDSGPGPVPGERMFDPFYSGRQAGRGRGLGLPTAWRMAHEHGGDVFYDDQSGGPTRFVLRLPRALEVCQSTDSHAA